MNCFLFGGVPSVGKSESIHRLAVDLIGRGLTDRLKLVPAVFTDFRAVLDGTDLNGKPVHVILNSATDTTTSFRISKVSSTFMDGMIS